MICLKLVSLVNIFNYSAFCRIVLNKSIILPVKFLLSLTKLAR